MFLSVRSATLILEGEKKKNWCQVGSTKSGGTWNLQGTLSWPHSKDTSKILVDPLTCKWRLKEEGVTLGTQIPLRHSPQSGRTSSPTVGIFTNKENGRSLKELRHTGPSKRWWGNSKPLKSYHKNRNLLKINIKKRSPSLRPSRRSDGRTNVVRH